MKPEISKIKKNIVFCAGVILTAAVIVKSGDVKEGVTNGFRICTNVVMPSLFPMLILSAFFCRTGIPSIARKLLFFPVRFISGASDASVEAYLYGAVCGYPVGVKTAVSLYDSGRIPLKEAQTAALININPGLAFSVIVAGKSYFGSVAAGGGLYGSVCLANTVLCILNRDKKSNKHDYLFTENSDISDALINAVSDAVKSSVSICSWITVFSAFSAILPAFTERIPFVLFAEVTAAVRYCSARRFLPLCAFSLAFGGLCVFCQLLPDLHRLRLPARKYLSARIFAGICAFLFETLFIKIFPQQIPASHTLGISFFPYESSAPGSASLALLCAVFMFSIFSENSVNKKAPHLKRGKFFCINACE